MSNLEVFRLSIAFVEPFRSATGTITHRRVVVVAYDADGVRGWGEAAPWPGQTTMDAQDTWRALSSSTAWTGGGDPGGPGDTVRAALEEAEADQTARAAGIPLWRHLGGDAGPVRACAAIGIFHPIDELLSRVGSVVDRGYTSIKLKIAPGYTLEPFRAVQSSHPALAVGVDGNGAYAGPDDELTALARLHPAYIEQPFPAARHDLAADFRSVTGAVMVADETVHTLEDAQTAVRAAAADIITIKVGRVGVRTAYEIVRWARAEGIPLKVSGLFETSVGRAHTLAFATLPEVQYVDFSPAHEQLAHDIVRDPWAVVDGHVQPRSSPGIGVAVDEAALRAQADAMVTYQLWDHARTER